MLRADFFSTAYHPPRSIPASGMSFEGSRHSVPLGSPMNRAPPLAVSLFLPPVLSNLSSRSVWRCHRCAWRTRTTTGQSIPRAQRTRGVRAGTAGRVQRQVLYRNEPVNGNSRRDRVFPANLPGFPRRFVRLRASLKAMHIHHSGEAHVAVCS